MFESRWIGIISSCLYLALSIVVISGCEAEMTTDTVSGTASSALKNLELTCCLDDNGEQLLTSAKKCAKVGGLAQPESVCMQKAAALVCCLLKDGTTTTTDSAICASLQGNALPVSMCEDIKPADPVSVCCETEEGTGFMLLKECLFTGGTQVAIDLCITPVKEVCCKLSNGVFTLPGSECKAEGGTIVAEEFCDTAPVSVCCDTADGPTFMIASECMSDGGSLLPISDCETPHPLVCCELPDGTFLTLIDQKCFSNGGVPVADELCEEETVCCAIEDALIDSLTATSCVAEGGLVLADEECNEPNPEVCCLFEGFQTTIPLSECTSEGGVPSPVEACEATTDICCLLPCGSTVSVPADACEAVGGTIAPEEMCEPCCLLPCGQAVSAPADACELVGGTMTSGEMCSPEACCTLPCGMHSNMPASACIAAGGTVSPVEVCDAVVCCSLDSGTVTMTSSQCTDAGGEVVSDEFCLDEEICCAFEIGQPIQATAEDCLEQGGLVVDHTVCENPEVCCMFADGSTAQLSQQECHDQGGEEVSPEACEPQDAICCVFDDGSTAEITPNECEAQGGIIGTPEQCEIQEPTCCLLPQGTTILMTPSECAGAGGTLTTMDQCESPCATDVDKNLSLIVTDTAALELFPHDEVLGQILATSGSTNATQTANTVFQQWWGSQRERTALDPAHHPFCDDNGGQINGFDIACPRAESVLENHVPNTHTPVALVNRFDLAPLNGGHCGEYRIVYALTNGAPGRNFIIYEAVLPNPDPACGIESCRPVAEFWASLTDEPDASVRAALLQDFYFNGLPGFAPVIQAAHYGLGSPVAGQIRTNQFMGGPWNLREFNTALECDPADPATCDLLIRQTTVKGNPSPSVVDGSAGTPLTNDFETDFIAQLPLLTPATEDINQLLMDTSDDFNTGESISQGGSPNSSIYFPSFALATAIDNALPVTSNLGSGDIIARLQTQTCGGCHQTSGNANLGTQDSGAAPLMWPAKSPMFVHIDENSTLSNALVMPGGFLDARKSVLEEFLVLTCDGGCNTPQLFRTIDGSLTADVMSVDKGVLAPSTSNKMKDTLSGAIVH